MQTLHLLVCSLVLNGSALKATLHRSRRLQGSKFQASSITANGPATVSANSTSSANSTRSIAYKPCSRRIYFLLEPFLDVSHANYQHMAVALGEGLRDIGCGVHANLDYWTDETGSPYLFKKTHEDPRKFDAVVVPYHMWRNMSKDLYFHHAPTKLVMLDWADMFHKMWGAQPISWDVYYKSSYSYANMPRDVKKPLLPASYYLTNRIMGAGLDAELKWQGTNRSFQYIWPHSKIMHPVRRIMQEKFLSKLPEEFIFKTVKKPITNRSRDYHSWVYTGARHDSSFYDAMQQAQAMDCTGGHLKDGYIWQWESFKLWEALASGIAVILPDMELYGMVLPVMPTKWVHYVPVVLEDEKLDELRENLTQGRVDLIGIGKAGRTWAFTHYSPMAFAKRFMRDVFE